MKTGTGCIVAGMAVFIALAAASQSCTSATPRTDPGSTAHFAAVTPTPTHELHNVFTIAGDGRTIISGASPDTDAAFQELRSLGIRTIISVDGASPDVALAHAHGLRYVHIPVTYAEVTEPERLALARAVRDLPGPVYIHCHHGKHRGPAAAAAVSVALSLLSPQKGIGFMKEAGTAPNYAGLYACVAGATPASEQELDAAPDEFPEVHRPKGFVAAMVETDMVFEHLKDVRSAGWRVPAANPDLVPASEAGRLADLLRMGAEDPRAIARGADFMNTLSASVQAATDLENAIVRGDPAPELERRWKVVATSCTGCHATYRDKPEWER